MLVKEIDSEGRVELNDYGRPRISYDIGMKDLKYMKQGLVVAAEIHFAAGAKRVMTLHSQKNEHTSLRSMNEGLANAQWGKNEIALYSAYPLGTCRMSEHPLRLVVNSNCETHDVNGQLLMEALRRPLLA